METFHKHLVPSFHLEFSEPVNETVTINGTDTSRILVYWVEDRGYLCSWRHGRTERLKLLIIVILRYVGILVLREADK